MARKIEIAKPNLTQYQKDFLYNGARYTITESSTKAGKTFSHIWWLFEMAHKEENKPNSNFWWVAPSHNVSKIAFNRIKVKVAASGLYKINETNLTITTPNNCIMHFKSGEKPDLLYGEDVYAVVMDEAPRCRVEAFYALRSTLTATRGPMKLIGNFGGTANWMHQLKEKALTDPEYAYFKITAWDAVKAGILDQGEIEQAQRDLPTKVFQQLYLAEETETESMLCTYNAIKSLWTNTHVVTGTKYITADIALHGSDKFIIYVWDGFKMIETHSIGKCDATQVTDLLINLSNKHSVLRTNIVYDADGLGAFLKGYLPNAKAFNNGGKPIDDTANYKNLKAECAYALAKAINNGEIWIACDIDKEQLIKELECLQSYNVDSEGKMQILPKAKIKEIIGSSSDHLDALIMRMYFTLKKKIITYSAVFGSK
jgi:hypothetical protein